jgi:hypothetical protein
MRATPKPRHFVIQGVTECGRTFRPSDWAERLSSTLGSFDADARLRYRKEVQPIVVEGRSCIAVCPSLEQSQPDGFKYLMDFARENNLRVLQPIENQAAN